MLPNFWEAQQSRRSFRDAAANSMNPHKREETEMRKAISVLVLVLALACSTYAGEMPNGTPAPPPSQPATVVQGPTTDDEISTGAAAPAADGIIQNGAAFTFAQVLLNLLALS
jgi:hypothetical protein